MEHAEEQVENSVTQQQTFMDSIWSINYILSVIWYIILCIRMSSYFGWFQNWTQTVFTEPVTVSETYFIGSYADNMTMVGEWVKKNVTLRPDLRHFYAYTTTILKYT